MRVACRCNVRGSLIVDGVHLAMFVVPFPSSSRELYVVQHYLVQWV